jgi:membrane-associated phospholipid phosphatase
MDFWTGITLFGDAGITTVLALAIFGWLLAEKERRLAFNWALLLAVCMAIVTLSKMVFIGWGVGVRSLNFTGFSGHATRSAVVWPVLGYLLLNHVSPRARMAGVLGGLAFALLIGVSRLALRAHSISEVVFGLLLGSATSLAFIAFAAPLQKPVLNRLRAGLLLLLLLPTPFVEPAPTQQWLTKITLYFSGQDRPFHRYHWYREHRRQPT